MVTCDETGNMFLFKHNDDLINEIPKAYHVHNGAINKIMFSQNDEILVSMCSHDGMICTWNGKKKNIYIN